MVYVGNETKNVNTTEKERESFCINDEEILQLARWAVIIEEHYSKKAGYHKPMDMEWAKDGDGKKQGQENSS